MNLEGATSDHVDYSFRATTSQVLHCGSKKTKLKMWYTGLKMNDGSVRGVMT